MTINAFFLGLCIARCLNFSLKNEPFIWQATHKTFTKIKYRYLLPLVEQDRVGLKAQ